MLGGVFQTGKQLIKDTLSLSAIELLLSKEPEICAWVDALGMRVLLGRNIFGESKTYLESGNDSELNDIKKTLRKLFIKITNETETGSHCIEMFVLPGDCIFEQLIDTDIGTPAAVIWVVIYFYWHKKKSYPVL